MADDLISGSVWMRPDQPRRGQPALSRDQIVTAAVELLDAEGLDGLSMRRLGAALGSGATSLYWYVANKDELLDLAVDKVFGEIEMPSPPTDWRAASAECARGYRAAILRHPWLTGLLGTRLTIGPNALRLGDSAVAALTTAGFTGLDIAKASSLLMSHALGSAMVDAAAQRWVKTHGAAAKELVQAMEPYLDRVGSDYPNYHEWWKGNKDKDLETHAESSFEFGLERLLDGLEGWLSGQAGTDPASSS